MHKAGENTKRIIWGKIRIFILQATLVRPNVPSKSLKFRKEIISVDLRSLMNITKVRV